MTLSRALPQLVLIVTGLSLAGCTAVSETVYRGNDPLSHLPVAHATEVATSNRVTTGGPVVGTTTVEGRVDAASPAESPAGAETLAVETVNEAVPSTRHLPGVEGSVVTRADWQADGAELQLDPLDTSFNALEPPQRDMPEESTSYTLSERLERDWSDICSDHAEFYSTRGLLGLAGGVGAAALMANTGFDEQLARDSYMDSIVLAPSDEFYEALHEPKFLGEGRYTVPVFAAAALAEPLIAELPLGAETAEWGRRSLRTLLVGAPPMLALQVLTGGGRPSETVENSEWQPLDDNNGVSGHAFMGAIPFISAAKMTDKVWLKGGLYAASTLPAISRVNDDDHYVSQVFLGWWLAYLAESAIDRTYDPDSHHHFVAYPQANGIGVGVEFTR